MKSALIGYTGFVGSNINDQHKFTELYNSKNITKIKNKKYDLVVSAGIPGTKWIANKYPVKDLENIKKFINSIKTVQARKFVLISTEDVYENPYKVNEKTKINSANVQPYGKNRLFLEKKLKNIFKKSLIVIRLPGLIGKNLKKNFIYDFIHERKYYLSNSESMVQVYDLKNIWKDLKKTIKYSLPIINFAPEPIRVADIVKYVFGINFVNKDKKRFLNYDVSSVYAHHYGNSDKYLYNKKRVLNSIKKFVYLEKLKLEGKPLKKMKDIIY
ncbi:MAG: pyridine nucleotide transhydrogenase [Patescibacteria group bacterium]